MKRDIPTYLRAEYHFLIDTHSSMSMSMSSLKCRKAKKRNYMLQSLYFSIPFITFAT